MIAPYGALSVARGVRDIAFEVLLRFSPHGKRVRGHLGSRELTQVNHIR
jgi:hypothetical protein